MTRQNVVSHCPSRFLRTEPGQPLPVATLGLAAFSGNGCPGDLGDHAAQHAVPFGATVGGRNAGTPVMARTASRPGGQVARRGEGGGAGPHFGDDLLGRQRTDSRMPAQAHEGFLLRRLRRRQALLQLRHMLLGLLDLFQIQPEHQALGSGEATPEGIAQFFFAGT